MNLWKKYREMYKKITAYRQGEYAGEFAKVNIYNFLALLLFVALVFAINILIFSFQAELMQTKFITQSILFFTILICAAILHSYRNKPLTERNRKLLVCLFALFLIGMMLPHIYFEIKLNGGLYNYTIMLFVLGAIPNLKIRETVVIALFTNCIVLTMFYYNYQAVGVFTLSTFDEVRYMIIITLLCFIAGIRNHVQYLYMVRDNVRFERASYIDPLTCLYNRRGMENFLQHHQSAKAAVCMLDIDDFKTYNDTYGHDSGDKCLSMVGLILKGLKNSADVLCVRYGGEEFVVIFFNNTSDIAFELMEQCRQSIKETSQAHFPKEVSISSGLVWSEKAPAGIKDYYKLINEADKLLYEAKAAGKDQIFVG